MERTIMEYDLSNDMDVTCKLEPDDDELSQGELSVSPIGTNTSGSSQLSKPLGEFNCETDFSMCKSYRCEGGDLSCGGSSPDSLENKHECCSSTNFPEQEGVKRLCLVCGDVASGYHYGVASCEACKAFFKRTIQGNIEYNCPASSSCEITKRRRKACQACRFQKCLGMGMLKEGVRLDRVRGGRQKYKRSPEHMSVSIHHGSALKKFCSDEKMLAALLAIEPEKVFAMPDPQLSDNEYKLMTTLSDLADRELVATIGWAKQVPGFINLPLCDQMNLLQSTWLDILCFNLAFRSTPYKGLLVYADDFKCSEEDAIKLSSPVDMDNICRRLSKKLSDMNITKEEYILMKAMLLLNPDIIVDSSDTVQHLRDRMYDTLLDHVRSRGNATGGGPNSNERRVGNLLMALPMLMQAKIFAREYWFNVKKDGRVPLHKLLSEMLEYACS